MSATQPQSQWVEEITKSRIEMNNLRSQHQTTQSQKMSQHSQKSQFPQEIPRTRVIAEKSDTPDDSSHLEPPIIQPINGSSSPGVGIEITPVSNHRSTRYEGKRFIDQETPVRGGQTNPVTNGLGVAIETPALPINDFGNNPFGPVHDGAIGLTQVFRQTQAPSSPLLTRKMASSQQPPTPGLPIRHDTLNILSDVQEELSPIRVSSDLTADQDDRSDIESLNSNRDFSSQKRGLEEDEGLTSSPSNVFTSNKRRRIGPSQAVNVSTTQQNQSKASRSGAVTRSRSNVSPIPPIGLSDDETNESEQETDRENPMEEAPSAVVADESEGNKENQAILREYLESPGIRIKRALQQPIPGSSSPRNGTPATVRQAHLSPSRLQLRSSRLEASQPIIADSQSSQQRAKVAQGQPQVSNIVSSNDKVIPGTQTVRMSSSRHVTSTATKSVNPKSQQTASPPNSRSGSFHSRAAVDRLDEQADPPIPGSHPTPPRSSPPLSDMLQTVGNDEDKLEPDVDEIEDEDMYEHEIQNTRSFPVGKTPKRKARQSSTIPETMINTRHTSYFTGKQPIRRRDQFEVAEGMDPSFVHSRGSFYDKEVPMLPRITKPLAESFGSAKGAASPVRRSTRNRPKPFAEIGGGPSQDQDSEDVSNLPWNTQDRDFLKLVSEDAPPSSDIHRPRRRARAEPAAESLDDPAPFGDIMSAAEEIPDSGEIESHEASIIAQDIPAMGNDIETNQEPDESIPFLDSPRPAKHKNVYGRCARATKTKPKDQTKASSSHSKRKHNMKTVIKKVDPVPSVTEPPKRGRGRPRKSLPSAIATPTAATQAMSAKSSKSFKRGTMNSSFVTAQTSLSSAAPTPAVSTPIMTRPPLEPPSSLSARVLAEYRGTQPGFFPATCIGRHQGAGEMKYQVRFEDGAIDTNLGITKIKRLEFRLGDEVKVDQLQYKSTIFVVSGFGEKLSAEILAQTGFPATDVYGHETIKVREKIITSSKKNVGQAVELDVSVSELYLARNMWSALKDRDYVFVPTKVNLARNVATPVMSDHATAFNSPESRTRSTHKIRVDGTPMADAGGLTQNNVKASGKIKGIFCNVVLVFSGITNDVDQLERDVSQQGGTVLPSFEQMFDTPTTQDLSPDDDSDEDEDGSSNHEDDNDTAQSSHQSTSLGVCTAFESTHLAVLVTDKVRRSTKYFKALALGIPCLSYRWVQDCLQSETLRNWRPYLLAAGESEYLSTVASQQLNCTYEEISQGSLRLPLLLNRREQWLRNSRILIVGSGNDESSLERLEAHIFIAWALGAAKVSTIPTLKEAEEHLISESDHDYDWIVVDNEKEKNTARGEKRTKRQSATSGGGGAIESLRAVVSNSKKCRTNIMGTQRVLESLILGGLIDNNKLE